MPKEIAIITEDEHVKFSNEKNLFFQHKGDVICLHDEAKKGNSQIGWFKVWYDSEEDDREYITLNHTITYLDTLSEL